MLQLVSNSQLLASRFSRTISTFGSFISIRFLRCAVVMFAVFAGFAHAQDITMPSVEIDGVDDDSSGDQIMLGVFKFAGRIALWMVIVIASVVALTRIIKSWNAQKNNDEGRWGAVISDVAGSTVLLILLIALATWALTFLA